MASKRVMYKPAPQENVGQRKNRKPLSQGRLMSAGDNSKSKHVHLASGIEDSSIVNRKPQSPYTSFASQKNDPTVNPRILATSLTGNHSPHKNDRADSLDLSDSDEDLSTQYKSSRVHKQQPSEVLLVDASRQTKNPNQSDVDIIVGFERPPVKIVCHTPDKVNSELRSSKNKFVKVDTVNTVMITREIPEIVNINLSQGEPCQTLDNLNLLTQIEKDMRISRLPQPNFDDSQDSDMIEKPTQDVDFNLPEDNHSINSDAGSVKDLLTNKKAKHKSVAKKPTVPGKTPQTAKKKASRVVASRFMQAADAKVKTSTSVLYPSSVLYPKTSKNDKNISKISRSMDVGPRSRRKISHKESVNENTPRTVKRPKSSTRDAKSGKSFPRGNESSHIKESGVDQIKDASPQTPDNSHMTTGGQTSTPTHDEFVFPQEIDASAIHPEISVLSTGDASKLNHSVLAAMSLPVSLPVKKKKEAKITQNQLDMMYARYIQSLYLSTKAQKVREEQEKQAMAQIQGLYTEVEKLQKKNHELDKELIRLRHLNEVDEQIDLQRQSLGPIVSSLPQLTKEYDTLAHALDTTRHQIPTKGVYIPDDEDQYQRDLEQALLESEQLLGELSVMIRKDIPSVTAMSQALSAMEKATDNQCEQLVRCNEMIAATQSLTIQETSMKIQAIQATEVGAA